MLLYATAIFLSAFLLFEVQPMIGKIILPWFGGSLPFGALACCFSRRRCWQDTCTRPAPRAT